MNDLFRYIVYESVWGTVLLLLLMFVISMSISMFAHLVIRPRIGLEEDQDK